jgi:hypothetical protein
LDHDVGAVEPEQRAGLGQSIAAGRVVGAGQQRVDAVCSTGLDDVGSGRPRRRQRFALDSAARCATRTIIGRR